MKIECSYCGKTIKASRDETGVSHGVCSDCLADVFSSHDISIEECLEAMPYPAILVNEAGEPIAQNTLYRAKIGDDTSDSKHILDGRTTVGDDASPSGQRCDGKSTVRSFVTETMQNGTDSNVTTATTRIKRGGRPSQVNMLIATQRIGKDIIVGIEDILSVQWYSALSTGREDLDRQHFEIDQILHQLGSCSFDDGIRLMKKLIRKLKDHFSYEEDLLRGGRLLVDSDHRTAHRNLMKWVVTRLQEASKTRAADFAAISTHLEEELMTHVEAFDQLH